MVYTLYRMDELIHVIVAVLTASVLEPVDGCVHDADTAQEASTLLLVHLLVVPNTDCDRVFMADVPETTTAHW